MTLTFIMKWCCIIMLLHSNGIVLSEGIKEGACNASRTGNKGKEFILAFGYGSLGPYDVKLFVSSTENVSVSIESPDPGFRTQHIVNNAGTQELIVDRSIVQSENGISNKSIIIRSSSEVSVHGLRYPVDYTADGFTALPTESLSSTYVISLYDVKLPVYIIIASVHDGTSVSITLNIIDRIVFEHISYKNGDTIHVHLQKFQSFMLRHSSDLSGTIVKSNKPISVSSGGDVHFPKSAYDFDCILSELLPVEHWDTKFIVPPLYPHSDSFIRIYAFYPNTSVTIRNAMHYKTHNFTRRMFIEEHLGNEPVVVNSSQAISIVQYAFSEGYDSSLNGDSIMMVVPGIHQFSSDYLFPTKIDHMEMKHYVAVIIKKISLSGLRVDGKLLAAKTFPVHFSEEDYVVAVQELRGSFHKLTHTDHTIKFGALVYGFGYKLGYGFPAGFEFTDVVSCQTTQMPSTTQTTSTTQLPSTTQTSSTTQLPSTTQMPSTITGFVSKVSFGTTQISSAGTDFVSKGIGSSVQERIIHTYAIPEGFWRETKSKPALKNKWKTNNISHVRFDQSKELKNNLVCFSCTEMPHLKYCDQLEKCNDNLGCFIERNLIGSHISYNSGCVKSNKESCEENNNNPSRCSRCCKTSFCNSHGCGDDGFGSHDSRGPLCYDCQHLSHPSECLNIMQCAHGEFCYIEERLWGDNDKVYSIGCRPKYHCRSASSVLNPDHTIIGRSVTTCSECCEGDFCNTNCTVLALYPTTG